VPTEIQTRNDGQKAFYINDPDGNRIELMQMAADSMQFEAVKKLATAALMPVATN